MPDQPGIQAFRQALPASLFNSLPDARYLVAGLQDLQNAVRINSIVPDV